MSKPMSLHQEHEIAVRRHKRIAFGAIGVILVVGALLIAWAFFWFGPREEECGIRCADEILSGGHCQTGLNFDTWEIECSCYRLTNQMTVTGEVERLRDLIWGCKNACGEAGEPGGNWVDKWDCFCDRPGKALLQVEPSKWKD